MFPRRFDTLQQNSFAIFADFPQINPVFRKIGRFSAFHTRPQKVKDETRLGLPG
jgi:hypothetical protein